MLQARQVPVGSCCVCNMTEMFVAGVKKTSEIVLFVIFSSCCHISTTAYFAMCDLQARTTVVQRLITRPSTAQDLWQ
jgi:hypothetical protein